MEMKGDNVHMFIEDKKLEIIVNKDSCFLLKNEYEGEHSDYLVTVFCGSDSAEVSSLDSDSRTGTGVALGSCRVSYAVAMRAKERLRTEEVHFIRGGFCFGHSLSNFSEICNKCP